MTARATPPVPGPVDGSPERTLAALQAARDKRAAAEIELLQETIA